MTKEILYTYLGTNGTITSPVYLEDTYFVRKFKLTADKGFVLKKTGKSDTFASVIIPEAEESEWKEVKKGQD